MASSAIGGRPTLEELSQDRFFFLKEKNGVTHVQHRITDEVKELPLGGRWSLQVQGGRVLANDSSGAHESMWVNALLRTALLKLWDRIVVQLKATADEGE